VLQVLERPFLNTAILALTSVLFGACVGGVLGTLAAARVHSLWDSLASLFAAGSLAMPTFFLGLLLIFFFAGRLEWFSALGMPTPGGLVLPTLTLGLPASAAVARMTRGTMLEVLNEEYVRTARAKGLRERVVLWRHALRVAALPVVTIIGLQLGFLLGGSVIVETIFSYPGVGQNIFNAIGSRDFPVVEGGVIFVALGFAVVNLLVDLSYAYLDPRIRYS
jgi:peptide/nickel transport system permease protein/oligopeptide transport system permease protein